MAKFIVEDGDLPEMKEKASPGARGGRVAQTDRGKVEAMTAPFARVNYVPDADAAVLLPPPVHALPRRAPNSA